jgi:hypothetical protein
MQLPLSDPRWKTLSGGYRIPYDASIALSRLERGEDAWSELWEELDHQGDVGEASYAAVPHIVRIAKAQRRASWEPCALVSTIEVERHRKSNPPLPEWLATSSLHAIRDLGAFALVELEYAQDPPLVRSALGVALSKGLLRFGALIGCLDVSEIDEILEEQMAWSELHSQR